MPILHLVSMQGGVEPGEGTQYFTCDFEESTCPTALQMVQSFDADSEFQWTRGIGCTPTANTGPCTDHTATGPGKLHK